MRATFLSIALAVMVSGCVTPSTMLVNQDNRVVRCAAHGWGWGIAGVAAMSAAEQSHDRCVSDAMLVGFIPIPKAAYGFDVDPKSMPLRVINVRSNATSAGMQVGDIVVEADNKPITTPFSLMKTLSAKKTGDHVVVTVKRGDAEKALNFELVDRLTAIQGD
jgi:S1-C subfamily serine protease